MIKIIESSINLTCGACPSQWNGTTQSGKDVLIHLRHGYLRISIEGHTIFDSNPNGFDGVMSTGELIQHVNTHAHYVVIE